MHTGMLWFDNDPKTTLDIKISQAADYYHHKYGRNPDMCMVNPAMLEKASPGTGAHQSGKIMVQPLRSVLPGHLWIGVDEKLPTGAD